MDLREYLEMLARRRTTIILVALVITAAGAAVGLRSSNEAVSRAVVAAPTVRADGVIAPMSPDVALERELEIARSEQVFERAAKRAGEPAAELRKVVTISPAAANSRGTIAFTATDQDAERAVQFANSVASAYVELTNESLLADLELYRDAVRASSAEATDDLLALLENLDRTGLATPELSIGRGATALDVRLADLAALLGMTSSRAQVVSPASPATAVGGLGRNVALGLTLGLFLGVAGALVQEQVDDRVRDVAAVRRSLPDVAVLDATGRTARSPEHTVGVLGAIIAAGCRGDRCRLAVVTPTADVVDPGIATGLEAVTGENVTITGAGALLETPDVARIASDIDGVVLVVGQDVTRITQVGEAATLLAELGLPLRAVVLTSTRP